MKKAIILGLCLVYGVFAQAAKAETRVVATIKPLHSLVAAVMGDTGTPELLIEGFASPHAYALRPSQARSLQSADVVFWIGPDIEGFLVKPLATTGQNAQSVALIDVEGITRKSYRDGHHDHDHGEHKDHAKHEHDKHEHDKHAHDKHEKDKHAHDEHKHEGHGHDHGSHDGDAVDPHIWLDPKNAQVMVRRIADVLSEHDPNAAATYRRNADAMIERLSQVSSEAAKTLADVSGAKYVVFHDAYQYFEARFGLAPAAAITLNPEVAPGAEQLRRIKQEIAETGVKCAFSEPQFDPKLVQLVLEGSSAKFAELDPLGAAIPAGPDHYIQTIRQMARSFHACLS